MDAAARKPDSALVPIVYGPPQGRFRPARERWRIMSRKEPEYASRSVRLERHCLREIVMTTLRTLTTAAVVGSAVAALPGCSDGGSANGSAGAGSNLTGAHDEVVELADLGRGNEAVLPGSAGPDAGPEQFLAPAGTDLADGQSVFRFETFGNE